MTRIFCDGFGKEITEKNKCAGGAVHCPDSRLGTVVKKGAKKLKLEIITRDCFG